MVHLSYLRSTRHPSSAPSYASTSLWRGPGPRRGVEITRPIKSPGGGQGLAPSVLCDYSRGLSSLLRIDPGLRMHGKVLILAYGSLLVPLQLCVASNGLVPHPGHSYGTPYELRHPSLYVCGEERC